MIEAKTEEGGFAARLATKAAELARAHAESAMGASQGDPSRWRKAHLLWPLFAKDR